MNNTDVDNNMQLHIASAAVITRAYMVRDCPNGKTLVQLHGDDVAYFSLEPPVGFRTSHCRPATMPPKGS